MLAVTLLLIPARAQELRSPIDTRLDQWQPVRAGMWKITTVRTDPSGKRPGEATTTSACPYPAILFLNDIANIRLAEAGCRYSTYGVSDHVFHIAARCRPLAGGEHVETTTLHTSDNGDRFTAATSWRTSLGVVTVQRAGEWVSACKAN